MASVWSTTEVITVKKSKGQLVEKIRLTYTTKLEQGDEVYESVDFSVGVLRNALRIPAYKPYSLEASRDEIIKFLDDIHIKWEKKKGSDEISKSLTAMKRHQLNGEFSYVFTHFIQCLTAKVGNHDQASFSTTQMVYLAIKNWPFNYAQVIFDDMAARLKEPERKRYVANLRFLSTVLKAGMASYPTEGHYFILNISLKTIGAGVKDSDIRFRDVPQSLKIINGASLKVCLLP